MKKTWRTARFEPWSDETKTLQRECSSTDLAGPGLSAVYWNLISLSDSELHLINEMMITTTLNFESQRLNL